MGPALQLWKGRTVHERFVPFQRRFAYDLILIDLDIDRLGEANTAVNGFSIGRPDIFSFRSEDHGPRIKGVPLRPWAESKLQTAGVALEGGPIRLVTFPRHLFYKFAPLSVWYGYGPDGEPRGIIYEVNNTFGESHCYVASIQGERSRHTAEKSFHVSPFFDVSGQYRFTLRKPSDKLGLVIENLDKDQRQHLATLHARPVKTTTGNLLRLALKNPMSTIGVTLAIHWQALFIWAKGAGYRSKPAPPDPQTATLALSAPPRRQQPRRHAA